MHTPRFFEIIGLFGNRNISIPIEGNALILVGPNGIGKSSVTNIFYFFITRQWRRLVEYDFSEIAVWIDNEELRATRSDIVGLLQIERAIRSVPPTSRVQTYIETLRSHGALDEFVSNKRMNPKEREYYSSILRISPDQVRDFQRFIFRRFSTLDEDLFTVPGTNIEKRLSELIPNRTIYLPTYRRIEKDIQEIFPNIEERLKSSLVPDGSNKFIRSSKHYIDLVSFGMEDVRENIDKTTRYLRDYSLKQFNDLSGLYLRDVIRGTADRYSPSQLEKLDADGLSVILGRVSEQVLSRDDKELLRDKIIEMKGKKRKDMDVNDRYLAHYFGRLMTASEDISSQENQISNFVDVCNAYLAPAKSITYNDTTFEVNILDESGKPIDLSMLSSGEKQVVSLFSHLYLDNYEDQIVIIDEPELSLSVPWQKRFLPDILKSNQCNFIMSVTHSPFIYQNNLKKNAVDLRRKTKYS